MVSVCLLCMGFPQPGVRAARAETHMRVQRSAGADAQPASDHFLRDALPATIMASDPPDTTGDGFVLPEEKSKKKLAKEIAVFVIVAAFVAYFIVKVFIEKDNQSADTGSNGKPITPPQ
jgi:hypothetical protein